MIKLMTILVIFILGLALHSAYKYKNHKEGFDSKPRCPNLLIQKGSEIHLLNTKTAKIPGVNPIKFNNLEEYSEFVDWQNSVGIKCPVLHFQKSYNTQGYGVYKINKSPIEMPYEDEIIDANINGGKNKHYQGFDTHNQYIGQYNKLDKIVDECKNPSTNAMLTCWGGEEFSRNAYPKLNGRERGQAVRNNPKTLDQSMFVPERPMFQNRSMLEQDVFDEVNYQNVDDIQSRTSNLIGEQSSPISSISQTRTTTTDSLKGNTAAAATAATAATSVALATTPSTKQSGRQNKPSKPPRSIFKKVSKPRSPKSRLGPSKRPGGSRQNKPKRPGGSRQNKPKRPGGSRQNKPKRAGRSRQNKPKKPNKKQ
jgi:hypothetical protein